MITFSFKGKSSKDFGIYVVEDDRVLKPELSNNEIVVPGRNGSYDFGNNTYRNRPITLHLGILGDYTAYELRKKIRDISAWLDGRGKLIFDDEPELFYDAKIYEFIPFKIYGTNDFRDGSFNAGIATVNFSCFPFAMSEIKTLNLHAGHNSISYAGSAKMPTIIKIKNVGSTTIKTIQITQLKNKKK